MTRPTSLQRSAFAEIKFPGKERCVETNRCGLKRTPPFLDFANTELLSRKLGQGPIHRRLERSR